MRNKLILILCLFAINLFAQEKLRVGVLAYGTVNWELDVLKQNNLDKKNGFELEIVELASKNAQLIALQSKDVDVIVNDWIWVNAQRASGKDFTFYPYSKASGTLMVNEKSNIKSLADLKGKELGIGGGNFDKTWLLLRAYTKNRYKYDLKDTVNPVFASSPIIYKKMEDGSLEAAINFWHMNAKLEAKNIKPLIEIKDVYKELGIIYNDATSHMFNAFAMGEIADFDIQTQVEKRVGDRSNSSEGQVDEKMFGAYLKVSKEITDNLTLGFAALTTKDGYVSGKNLPVTYLTNDDLGTASLDKVGNYGDTTIAALNLEYKLTPDLTLESNLAQHNIKDASFSNIDKDLKINEYDLGLAYQLNKNAELSLRYALGTFDESTLEDMQTVVGAIRINF